MSLPRNRHRVLVIEDDDATQRLIQRTLARTGVETVACATFEAASAELESSAADAVILDVLLPDHDGLELIARARAARPHLPVIVVSRVSDFAKKLEALRLGADAYVEKPVDWDALVRKLESLLASDEGSACVLIVEDDPISAMAMRGVLESARHRVVVCGDPMQFEKAMVQTRPDLVLLDVALPSFSGLELARFLRQDSRFEATPVIYVTATGDPTIRSALSKAGDPVLPKPVRAEVLRGAVGATLARSRRLRDRMERDSLTGLLGRAAFVDHLRAAAAIACREPDRRGTLAMLDLDAFKLVNDRYGHAAGDVVLRETANVLRGALRATDVIGRVGGEEFAVLLATADEDEALALMGRVLDRCRAVRHEVAPAQIVTVTFSAGVATAVDDPEEWLAHADQALYRAKKEGRDRIVAYAAGPVEPQSVVLDRETIAGLRQLGRTANHDLVRELVDLFAVLAPDRIRLIAEAAARRDAAGVRSSAHALRGASGNLGIVPMHALCGELEHAADRLDWDTIDALALDLRDTYTAVGPALDELCAGS